MKPDSTVQHEPVYEVVSPAGVEPAVQDAGAAKYSAPPLEHMAGKRIGLIWTVFPNGNLILEAFEKLLGARFSGMTFVKLPPGRGLLWGQNPDSSLAEVVREQSIDAAIVAAGC
jgi:hypothetical protein